MYLFACLFLLLYLVLPDNVSAELKYVVKYIIRNNTLYIYIYIYVCVCVCVCVYV